MTRKDCLYDVGYVGVSKDGLEYMVIERNGRKCKVKFTLSFKHEFSTGCGKQC